MSPRTRRRFCALLAGAAAPLAGCSGGGSGPAEGTETTETPLPTMTVGDRQPMDRPENFSELPQETAEAISVDPADAGSGGQHFVEPTVRIWNDGPARTVAVSIRGASTGPAIDRSFDIDADAVVEVHFRGRDSYRLSVRVAGEDEYATIVDRDQFFCNEPKIFVRVGPDGTVSESTFRTTMGCPTPNPQE